MSNIKPLGRKSYGSIPHLIGSRRGPGDRGVNEGQQRIATEKPRDKFDVVIVQEKLDGSNVAVAKVNGVIVPIIRAGYEALSAPREMHRLFAAWAYERTGSFDRLLENGERICGEWLAQAHGTAYDLTDLSPFVAFDIMREDQRVAHQDFCERTEWCVDSRLFDVAPLLHVGKPISVDAAMGFLGTFGRYGALDRAEGVVYRIERHKGTARVVDFLAKYVRPDKVDGCYVNETWNWRPSTEGATEC